MADFPRPTRYSQVGSNLKAHKALVAADERRIQRLLKPFRQAQTQFMAATRAGDVATVLSLMTDDVIFMVPGREPFGKVAFATASEQMKGVSIDGRAEIQELRVLGDWAYIRNYIEVTMTRDSGRPSRAAAIR